MEPNGNQEKKTKRGIKPILIETELKNSFLDYAMSVIIGRALPDVRDGVRASGKLAFLRCFSSLAGRALCPACSLCVCLSRDLAARSHRVPW